MIEVRGHELGGPGRRSSLRIAGMVLIAAIGAAGFFATGVGAGPEEGNMETVYVVDSQKTIEQVSEALEKACQTHKFGVIAKHDLQAKMRSKGVDFPEACLVYEICNPHKASEVLSQDMRISTALPCRVSIYRQGEGSRLATIRPRVMLDMFGAKGLEQVADEVERAIVAIMDDAAG